MVPVASTPGTRTLVVRFSGDAKGLQRGVKEAESKLDKFRRKVDKAWQSMKPAAIAGGAVAGAALVDGIMAGMDMERAVDRVSAALGATPEQSARIGEVAGNLYADAWGESAGEVAAAVEAVMVSIDGMGQASAAELQGATEHALAFAEAFQIDVQRAAQVAGEAVKYGLADNATEAFDLLTAAAQKVPPTLREEVVDAVDEYGHFFQMLGLDGPQAFGLLAAGAAKGQYGIDKTGDAVKEFTIRATDMSTATREAYETLGMSTEEMTNKLLAGGDTANEAFNQILDGLLSIPDAGEQAEAALALFGTPLEDLNVSEIPEFLQSLRDGQAALGDTAGKADELAGALQDNAQKTLDGFRRKVQTAIIDKLAAAVPHIEAVAGWMSRNKDVIGPLVGILAGLAAVIGTIIGVYKVWTAVQLALNIVMMANPVVLITLAIVALIAIVVLLIKHWDTVKEAFAKAWQWIWDKLKAFGAWLKEVFWEKGIKKYFQLWGNIIGWVRDRIKAGIDRIRDIASGILSWFKDLPGKLKDALSKVKDIVLTPFKAGFDAVKRAWNNTVGGKGFDVPSWVPGVGGKSFRIPKFHTGGVVPGPVGREVPILAQAGEVVLTRDQAAALGGGGVFEGVLVLDSGEFLGMVRGEIRRSAQQTRRRVLAGAGGAR